MHPAPRATLLHHLIIVLSAESHPRPQCPASRVTCKGCGKTGHFQRVCGSLPPSGSSSSSGRQGTHQSPRGTGVHSLSIHSDSSSSAVSSADAFLGTLTNGTGWNLLMLLHGKAITMMVDAGADVTAIPATVFTFLDLPIWLAPTSTVLATEIRLPDGWFHILAVSVS